jgi:hypothetical protein
VIATVDGVDQAPVEFKLTVKGCLSSDKIITSIPSNKAEYLVEDPTHTNSPLTYSISPANSACILVITKTALTASNGGTVGNVALDWSPNAANSSTAIGVAFKVNDETAPCTDANHC